MNHRKRGRITAGILALLVTAAYLPAVSAHADELQVPDFGAVTEMPSAPFGTASASSPYFAKPCNERLATLPEPLMKLTEDGYNWSYTYGTGKPAWALTLMDYANIYSFIHTHEIDEATLRAVLADPDSMLHKKAFTEEEIDLLLGDDAAAAMKAFASPSTIVIGEKGYCAKWMYTHTLEEYAAEGITPEMVEAVLPYYYNPLFVQKAADAFSQKLFQYTGKLAQTKWEQWKAGDVNLDSRINDDDTELLQSFLGGSAELTFPQWASADMDGDSDADADDLDALKKKIAAGIQDDSVMLNVIEYCQYPDYPTGCESVSLYMLLDYYGVDVKVDNIYDLLPMGPQPYIGEDGRRYGANPEREFVGDPRDENSYGVFNDPIAGVAEQFKPGVKTERGVSVDDIKSILDTGNPVLAWYVSAPMRDIMYRWTWYDEFDEAVTWPGGEHAVVICGYDDTSLTYRDPNAGTTVCIDYATFEKSFSELGSRIVYYTNEEVTDAVSYISETGLNLYTLPTVLTGTETALDAGWYAVTSDVAFDGNLTLNGDVNLILADGCTLTVNGSITGEHALTVYGQTDGTGALNITAAETAVSVSSYTQYAGKTLLHSDAEFALNGKDAVSLLGGQFESNAGVSAEGTLTFGYVRETDFILAGKYQAGTARVAKGQGFWLPELENDFSAADLAGMAALRYNGQMQTPTKEDLVGKLVFCMPLYQNYSGKSTISKSMYDMAANRKLCPYQDLTAYSNIAIEVPLTADDFDIGEVEAAKDVTYPTDGQPAKLYAIELIGKGEYTGSIVKGWKVEAVDVSDDIQVSVRDERLHDSKPVSAGDFIITASTPVAQELIDEIAAGKAQLSFNIYSTAPLTGEDITTEVKVDTALANGHIYDLSCFTPSRTVLLQKDEKALKNTIVSKLFGSSVYVLKDGEKLDNCIEIDENGTLSYYEVGRAGEETFVRTEKDPNMYWYFCNDTGKSVSLQKGYTPAQLSDGSEPGDYIAKLTISENELGNFLDAKMTVQFTVEDSEAGQIAPDKTLLEWAANDYQGKTGTAVTAVPVEKLDGTLAVALKDSEGNHVDSYNIDTATGIATNDAGEEVNLPQTGNNSMADIMLAAAAFMMLAAGAAAVYGASRRRKEDD